MGPDPLITHTSTLVIGHGYSPPVPACLIPRIFSGVESRVVDTKTMFLFVFSKEHFLAFLQNEKCDEKMPFLIFFINFTQL